MKDQDLEDIGRRLYDLEADPPKDGWDRLGAAIRTPKLSAKLIWFERNWWKPLVIVLPFLFYVWMSQTTTDKSHGTTSLAKLANEEKKLNPTTATNSNARSTEVIQEEKIASIDSKTSLQSSKNDPSTRSLTQRPIAESAEVQREQIVTSSEQQQIEVIDLPGKANVLVENQKGSDLSSTASFDRLPEQSTQRTLPSTEILVADSLMLTEKKESLEGITAKDSTEDRAEENSYVNPWRITAAMMPQFIWRSVSPNQNDEVFVTVVRDQKKGFTHLAGYSFSLGVSRAISSQWQLDAQLSLSRTKQEVHFSYANGNVDTLLAVVQADQSVRLVPVYEQIQQHTINKYTFIGLRLGATHYFWAKNKRRFNLSASFGTNYLASASVKQQTDAGWNELPNDGLEKLHYNFAVAAGYNYNFAPGWELMVSPTLLYNLRPLKNDQLPYQMSQRAFGLNVMLSKSLGKN